MPEFWTKSSPYPAFPQSSLVPWTPNTFLPIPTPQVHMPGPHWPEHPARHTGSPLHRGAPALGVGVGYKVVQWTQESLVTGSLLHPRFWH